jgi:hypothetical protein
VSSHALAHKRCLVLRVRAHALTDAAAALAARCSARVAACRSSSPS